MRNLVSLLSVILLFIGCAWGSLLENELTGSDSVLSESLGTSGVLPPSGLKFVSIAENASRQILVTWNSVANAKEYEVTVKGDHNETVKNQRGNQRHGKTDQRARIRNPAVL